MFAFRLCLTLIPLLLATMLSSAIAGERGPGKQDYQGSQSSGAGGSASSTASSPPARGAAVVETMAVTVPHVVLVPLAGQDPNLAGGCWVRLFDGPSLNGKDELTIAGPMDLQTLKTPSGINWQRKAESLLVGPHATVTVFESEMFKNKSLKFNANQQVPNLRKDLGFPHSIDSIKVACNK